jgi:hypothetical protein
MAEPELLNDKPVGTIEGVSRRSYINIIGYYKNLELLQTSSHLAYSLPLTFALPEIKKMISCLPTLRVHWEMYVAAF